MIEEGPLPGTALLQKYARSGAYTDCFHTSILENVSLDDYVEAFYTTWLFKLERLILKLAIKKPSTNEQARQVASGEIDKFAAWRVEGRDQHQLLMSDFRDQTRSWFMVVPGRLYFGSAVIPKDRPSYKLLLGAHRLYSRALLAAAKSRLQ
ncbi:MAG: hypothetical protein ACR2QS_09395 [Woeseiaceae bacterium]